MALKATIFKAELQIADMDRHYYNSHSLTIAQHPSETDERMMVRVLAFALYANEQLAFTKGISTDEEPDLWQKSLSDEIELWIELGQPDEKRLRKAAGRARQVVIVTYNSRSAAVWRKQMQDALAKLTNVTVRSLNNETVEALGKLAQRNMSLQCTIQDGDISLADERQQVSIAWDAV